MQHANGQEREHIHADQARTRNAEPVPAPAPALYPGAGQIGGGVTLEAALSAAGLGAARSKRLLALTHIVKNGSLEVSFFTR
eukprot:SAG11_NODE_12114_length_721_cov_1.040193_2_plen_82_part_00